MGVGGGGGGRGTAIYGQYRYVPRARVWLRFSVLKVGVVLALFGTASPVRSLVKVPFN